MKKFKLCTFVLAASILVCLLAPAALAVETPVLDSRCAVLVELEGGQVFFSKNEFDRIYPASLTKVMTVLLAVEACESGRVSASDEVVASNNIGFDLIADGSTQNIVPGEIMTLENLMYCALVASANEACNIIAEYIGGSVEQFIQMMNDRAASLNCVDTNFSNTHGLPNETHYTTAWDMYLVAQEAIRHPLFYQISNTVRWEVPSTNINGPRVIENTNALLGDTKDYTGYKYEFARGVKTGHTTAAGYCLISTAEKDNIRLMAVTMGGEPGKWDDGSVKITSFTDSANLYEWAFSNFSYKDVVKATDIIADVPVSMASGRNTVSVRPERPLTALLPNDTDINDFVRNIVIYSTRDNTELTAPINAGDVLGELTLTRDGVSYGKINLVATTSVDLSKLYYMRMELSKTLSKASVKIVIFLVILLFVAYAAYVIRYRILRIRHNQAVRRARRADGPEAPTLRGRSAKPPARNEYSDYFYDEEAEDHSYELGDDAELTPDDEIYEDQDEDY